MDKKDNIAVLIEVKNNRVSSLSLELLGKGSEIAEKLGRKLIAILVGNDNKEFEKELLEYKIDYIFSYEGIEVNTAPNVYANIVEKFIKDTDPSILLIGDNDFGKAIGTKIAVRFNTGLTSGCVDLEVDEMGKLFQIKPIAGDDIVAEMICKDKKPQIATVKKSVLNPIKKISEAQGSVIKESLEDIDLKSNFNIIETMKREISVPIEEAEVLVVAGRGFKNKEDLILAKNLAKKLNGEFATTRPLVEMGWSDHSMQVGISGKIVKPRLIITLGVSGAIQFKMGMDKSDNIVAVNIDKDAPIFEIANYGLVGDLYEIVSEMLK